MARRPVQEATAVAAATATASAVAVPPASGTRTTNTPTVFGEAKAFARALRTVLPFVCPDSTRWTICKVYLRLKGDHITLVATDGHTLARWEQRVKSAHVEGEMGILTEDAEKIIKSYRNSLGELTIDVAARAFVADGMTIETDKKVSPDFPPFEQIIPRADALGKLSAIGAAPHYLERAFKAFGDAVKGRKDKEGAALTPFAKLEVTGDACDPMRITSAMVPELYILVMPVKL